METTARAAVILQMPTETFFLNDGIKKASSMLMLNQRKRWINDAITHGIRDNVLNSITALSKTHGEIERLYENLRIIESD